MESKVSIQLNEHLAMHVSYISIVINILLSAFKLFAGIIGHSAAMISDAIHSASDVFSTFIVIIGIHISNKASDSTHQYGHEKLEYIAAMFLAFVLLVTGLGIGYEGMRNIFADTYECLQAPTLIALMAAILSIIVKEAMFWYTKGAAVKIDSGALMADAWHHRSDAFSSIGSLIGIGGAMLGYPIMDSLASVVICLMIIYAAWKIFVDATNKLVDHACDETTLAAMRKHVLSQDGVHGIDEIRTRMFGAKFYVDIDISADGNQSLYHAHHIAEKVHDTIEHNFPNVKHCMVHVSPSRKD
jgi:cation diffusion facilitator family transporter